jgi:hypothetical protein
MGSKYSLVVRVYHGHVSIAQPSAYVFDFATNPNTTYESQGTFTGCDWTTHLTPIVLEAPTGTQNSLQSANVQFVYDMTTKSANFTMQGLDVDGFQMATDTTISMSHWVTQ